MEEHQPGLDKKAYYVHTTSGMNMDSLIKAIRHTNPGVRWRAALALGDIGEPAIKPLMRALGKLGSSAPVETLMQSLKNPAW